ncbi:MAG: hypothetical protein QM765_31580 [Myxococcales bacterium]
MSAWALRSVASACRVSSLGLGALLGLARVGFGLLGLGEGGGEVLLELGGLLLEGLPGVGFGLGQELLAQPGDLLVLDLLLGVRGAAGVVGAALLEVAARLAHLRFDPLELGALAQGLGTGDDPCQRFQRVGRGSSGQVEVEQRPGGGLGQAKVLGVGVEVAAQQVDRLVVAARLAQPAGKLQGLVREARGAGDGLGQLLDVVVLEVGADGRDHLVLALADGDAGPVALQRSDQAVEFKDLGFGERQLERQRLALGEVARAHHQVAGGELGGIGEGAAGPGGVVDPQHGCEPDVGRATGRRPSAALAGGVFDHAAPTLPWATARARKLRGEGKILCNCAHF